MAEIGNKLYDYYALRYGIFLKNVRYVEYDVNFRLCRLMILGRRSIGSGLITFISCPITRNF